MTLFSVCKVRSFFSPKWASRWKLLPDCVWKEPNFICGISISWWIGELCLEYTLFSGKTVSSVENSSKLVYSMNLTVFLGCPNFLWLQDLCTGKFKLWLYDSIHKIIVLHSLSLLWVEWCMYNQIVHVHVLFLYNNLVNIIFGTQSNSCLYIHWAESEWGYFSSLPTCMLYITVHLPNLVYRHSIICVP